ncbi:hypothetical protein K501DRAFT_287508 [Backusella circina FSU 941]|nr:hypothetical protein K501DRAFT_287508 [Backusella circina FSU 941]
MGYYKSMKSMRKYVMCTVCHSLYAESPLSVIPNECTKMRSRRAKCKKTRFFIHQPSLINLADLSKRLLIVPQ